MNGMRPLPDDHSGVTVRAAGAEVSSAELVLWETQFARRCLMMLKQRLGADRLRELLASDIAESTRRFGEWRTASGGELRSFTVEIDIDGVTAGQFSGWYAANVNGPAMLAAHPEHFVFEETNGTVSIIETMGDAPVLLDVEPLPPDQAPGPLDPDYPYRVIGAGRLPDGEVTGAVLHQFRDVPGGCQAKLTCYFPAATPDDVIETHQRHVAVEFTNWLIAARDET
ncbi:hypothetical protein [Actinocrispum wychmicini]|uniref:Uncharacterized protein n=1 Tax=Actinocrispum wychmicini TaxID=1213861 RepID=A0A4R2J7T6_9PSEU|nr:hypothetical protein [Actinocrispum wychmicini]TCO55233.1 hypothetical protein EV192_108523 [Actinocrispum wychmicini]